MYFVNLPNQICVYIIHHALFEFLFRLIYQQTLQQFLTHLEDSLFGSGNIIYKTILKNFNFIFFFVPRNTHLT